jgi:hypothetical protein
MEPRQEVLKKTQDQPKEERKSRFQIVKLEERIAPRSCGGDGHGKHRCPRG